MKINTLSYNLILILCTAFLLAGCNGDVELSPEVIELDEPLTFGRVNLDITHYIPFGIGEIVVETSIPLEFPVKRGNRFIVGDISQDGAAESIWDLAGAGDFMGISTTMVVPTTFEIRGIFEQCVFTLDIVEILHFSQVATIDIAALGEIAADMGADERWEFASKVLTSADPVLDYQDPNVPGTITLGISNASLPPDISLICPYPTSTD